MSCSNEPPAITARKLVNIHDRLSQALHAISRTNSRWNEKLRDAELALVPMRVEDFPSHLRPKYEEILEEFNNLKMWNVGVGYILDPPSKCRAVCIKILDLIDLAGWEAIYLLQDAKFE